jgi:hypothetical protein
LPIKLAMAVLLPAIAVMSRAKEDEVFMVID